MERVRRPWRGRDGPRARRRGQRLTEPRSATVRYPGGITVRSRWTGSGQGPAIFALTEAGGELADHGSLGAADPDAACRAELRVEGPAGAWTVRLASAIYDEPRAVLWDVPGLLVVAYGFLTYGLDARTGALRWSHRSGSPVVALLASSLLEHVIVQTEVETFAIDAHGGVVWRLAHGDVVVAAELVGGQLVLSAYSGERIALDPRTGREAG